MGFLLLTRRNSLRSYSSVPVRWWWDLKEALVNSYAAIRTPVKAPKPRTLGTRPAVMGERGSRVVSGVAVEDHEVTAGERVDAYS